MEESTEVLLVRNPTNLDDSNILAELNYQEISPEKKSRPCSKDDSSDDDSPKQRIKKRMQQFSDSDTEKENLLTDTNNDVLGKSGSDSENENVLQESVIKRTRIRLEGSSSESDSRKQLETLKNEEQQMRLKNKNNKLKQKFKGLMKSRYKSSPQAQSNKKSSDDSSGSEKSGSEDSDIEMSSITKIKQKIKKSMSTMSSVCDPDTSDEEGNNQPAPKQRQTKTLKTTKMIEAKPIRMSAKQAMENMQLIKSESNRMLREKAVSLPYHRPKALSLKDIMSRRKPAVASDGKALPIKMNEQQLRQYALQLEQRQKEMMELCKSESDEETVEPEAAEQPKDETQESELKEHKDDIDGESSNHTKNNETDKINVNITDKVINTVPNELDNIITSTEMNTPSVELNTEVNITANVSVNSQNELNSDISLVYNDDSVEEENVADKLEDKIREEEETVNINPTENKSQVPLVNTDDSQLISLKYSESNTEKAISLGSNDNATEIPKPNDDSEKMKVSVDDDKIEDFFSDDDVNMEDIDRIIENAEIMKNTEENVNSPMLIKDPLSIKPKLMGAPGMVIDLDGSNPVMSKRSGVELLKERFTYFAKLKTPEEIERERERRIKPGAQHLKLKQELEEQIAEQRSLEWAKRLEEEKQQHQEIDTILDDDDDNDDDYNGDDSIEKIKSKLDEQNEKEESNSESEEEEDLVEDDIEIKDKPRKHNPMVDDEAEESDIDENDEEAHLGEGEPNEDVNGDEIIEEDENEESSEEEESSESEEEEQSSKPKKGRILKAFEDSDDEGITEKVDETEAATHNNITDNKSSEDILKCSSQINDEPVVSGDVQSSSQDDVIQLAQRHQSASDDLFTSQENSIPKEIIKDGNNASDEVLGTQTFSISSAKPTDFSYSSQPYNDPSLNLVTDGMTQNIFSSQLQTQTESQPIGEDILALCTGKFYDNKFVSQTDINQPIETISQDICIDDNFVNKDDIEQKSETEIDDIRPPINNTISSQNDKDTSKPNKEKTSKDCNILSSILDELDDPEFDKPKPNKFFTGATQNKKEIMESQMKKRLVIDSDEENDDTNVADEKKKKKLKKKKLEQRALQISDDEEEEEEELELEEEDYGSDLEEEGEKLVEYDSEENEIEVKIDKPKKKRKATDFFDQEAELTSEDEWVGSGDEDEHGLDRMEREEGDDEVFHQGKLRKELGQIHMRDVLEQDKREVRLLQELLFEDGDLGGGHRQRKFRWRNAADEETGTVPDEFADTQEEEFESEEQWRKQRHEREVFLRQMQKEGEAEESLNVTVNRTTIIKANLSAKSMSTVLMEANQSSTENNSSPVIPEKKSAKDVPSPKKAFSIFQQNYHSSLLTRGRGALARLAALATPLAVDDDAPKIGSLATHKRNFVFAALSQDDEQPKVTIKRKADVNLGTPKLVKKMRTEDKQNYPKSSLLDHLNL